MTMLRLLFFCLVAFAYASQTQAGEFGRFTGPVQAEWSPDGRNMKLLAGFEYIDRYGMRWAAPEGWIVDGASIPSFAWSIVGGPYSGKYRQASVIHDVACVRRVRHWNDVHLAFYYAMRAAGVGVVKASIMYGAVYHFGPRWTVRFQERVFEDQVMATTERIQSESAPGSALRIEVEDDYVVGIGVNGTPTKFPSGLKNVSVSVDPPPRRLIETDFEALKTTIEEQGLTLEQVRSFVPG